MSSDQNLTPEALKLIDEGDGKTSGFRVGSMTRLLVIRLSAWPGELKREDKKNLCAEYKLDDHTFSNTLGKMKKLKLWGDDKGGLGRIFETKKDTREEVDPKNMLREEVDVTKRDEKDAEVKVNEDRTSDQRGPQSSPVRIEGTKEGEKGPPVRVNGDGRGGLERTRSEETGQEGMIKAMFEFMNTMGKRLDAMEQKAASPVLAQPLPVPVQSTVNSLPVGPNPMQQQMDFLGFMKFVQSLPPEQKRLYFGQQATEKPEDPMLQVFQQLETDHAWVDIMEEQGIGFEDMQRYVEKFNTMKKLNAEKENLGTPYLAAWYDACRTIGENIRRGCQHYNEPDGTCTRWGLEDIAKAYRDTYRGMYRAMRNKEGFLFNVERCPEICAVCGRAKVLEGEE